jgi:hypothetical protein
MQRSAYSRSTVAGADYVGPLPAKLQGYVDFAVGVLAVSKQRDAAHALVKFMSLPEAAPLIRKSGKHNIRGQGRPGCIV